MRTVEVLYFAAVREKTQCSNQTFTWHAELTLNGLINEIVKRHPDVHDLLPYVRLAVDERFEDDLNVNVQPGAIIALIPPVSGGNWPYLVEEPIMVEDVASRVHHDECGAVVVFSGRVRNQTGDRQVLHLDYESYGSMAEKMLSQLVIDIGEAYPNTRIAVQHRIGHLEIGDVAVVVAVSSPHRDAAFSACRQLIDDLKANIPIFKKEVHRDGSIWVGLGG